MTQLQQTVERQAAEMVALRKELAKAKAHAEESLQKERNWRAKSAQVQKNLQELQSEFAMISRN